MLYFLLSLILRVLLYPYLIFKASAIFTDGRRRLLAGFLLVESMASVLNILVLFCSSDLLDLFLVLDYFVFFCLMFGIAFLIGVNLLLKLIFHFRGKSLNISYGHYRKYAQLIAILCCSFTLFLGLYAYHQATTAHLVRRSLELSAYKNPDGSQKHLRIGLLSDLHIGASLNKKLLKSSIRLLMAEEPELILVAGDYVDRRAEYLYDSEVIQMMKELKAKYGVFFTLGNHEYRLDTTRNCSWVKDCLGAKLLIDSVVYPADSLINLIGRDDRKHKSRKKIEDFKDELLPNRPTILLEHTPHAVDSLATAPIDLAFYGHTHGGQIFPMHLVVYMLYGMVHGSYQRAGTEVYVSSGLGAGRTPFRLASQSEVIIYDLYWK